MPVSKALVGKEVQKPLSGRAVDVKPDRSVQKIDINRCGEEELAKLPGINAILAKKGPLDTEMKKENSNQWKS